MSDTAIEIETSLSRDTVIDELKWAIAKYNEEKADNAAKVTINDIEIIESQGVTGSEIAFFLAGAAASGLTWDVMKYIALEIVVPRINKKFGSGAARPKH